MKLKWQQAPVKTQWGDEMVVASVAIDKDHTVCLYCERDQTPKVDSMFAQRKPLTEPEKQQLAENWFAEDWAITKAMGMMYDHERLLGIKENA